MITVRTAIRVALALCLCPQGTYALAPQASNVGPTAVRSVTLEVLGAKEGEPDSVVLRLTNGSDQHAYFYGYNARMPEYELQVKQTFRWRDANLDWCGTGMLLRRIDSKQSIDFVVGSHYASGKTFRVGIRLFPANGEGDGTVIWSPPIKAARS